MKIMKFGGSSLADPDCFRRVGRIVINAAADTNVCVVVSACQGITNRLLGCVAQAAAGKKKYRADLAAILAFHEALLQALFLPALNHSSHQSLLCTGT